MKTNCNELLQQLDIITRVNIEAATGFLNLNQGQLNFKPAPNSWSILECLEHLNRYAAFYIPEISRHLSTTSTPAKPEFKSGLIGNYLVNMVIPKEGGKKMKTFPKMDPKGSNLDIRTINEFIDTQEKLLRLIGAAKSEDLNKAGIAVTFTKLVKLKLGDALRFMASHNQRHILQAQRIKYGK